MFFHPIISLEFEKSKAGGVRSPGPLCVARRCDGIRTKLAHRQAGQLEPVARGFGVLRVVFQTSFSGVVGLSEGVLMGVS